MPTQLTISRLLSVARNPVCGAIVTRISRLVSSRLSGDGRTKNANLSLPLRYSITRNRYERGCRMHGHHRSLVCTELFVLFPLGTRERFRRIVPNFLAFPRPKLFPRLLSRRLCSSKELPIPRVLSDWNNKGSKFVQPRVYDEVRRSHKSRRDRNVQILRNRHCCWLFQSSTAHSATGRKIEEKRSSPTPSRDIPDHFRLLRYWF